LEYIPDFEIEKSDLDQPRVKLNYKMKTEYHNGSNLQVNIEVIKYCVILESSDSSYSNFRQELDLGEAYTYTPIFTKIGTDKILSVYFNIPTKALGKILDLLTKGHTVVLRLPAEIYGKVYHVKDSDLVGLVSIFSVGNPLASEAMATVALPIGIIAPMLAARYKVYESEAGSILISTAFLMIAMVPLFQYVGSLI
jgi:hypothetical protein